MKNTDQLRYPIGKYVPSGEISGEILNSKIDDIEYFPERLKETIKGFSEEMLDTSYREGGWTVRQLINHCADSHMNGLTRFKLALTEDEPVIKPYYEERWAELSDSRKIDVEPALMMIEGLHKRWAHLLRNLTHEQLKKVYIHPENGKKSSIEENIGMYAWHCNHHLTHIKELIKRKKW